MRTTGPSAMFAMILVFGRFSCPSFCPKVTAVTKYCKGVTFHTTWPTKRTVHAVLAGEIVTRCNTGSITPIATEHMTLAFMPTVCSLSAGQVK
jgi:hypothetical protein